MSKNFQYKWHGDEFNRQLRKSTAVGLKLAAVFFHARCRAAVNVINTGTRRKRTRDTAGGKKGSQYTTYDNSSKPGEPPRKRTGVGQSNIKWEYNDDKRDPAVRVGVTKKGLYMIFLELGTKTVLPRPWLLATLTKFWRMIGKLAATGGKGEIKNR